MKHKSFHKFKTLALGLFAFVTVASANQVTLQDDADTGEKYVNMPAPGHPDGKDTLFISAEDIAGGITTFKVYDDGGKDGNFSRYMDETLQLAAPKGYVFQVTGTVITYNRDYLSIYDGGSTLSPALLFAVNSPGFERNTGTVAYNIAVLASTDSLMTLNFVGGGEFYQNEGLNLTVSVVSASTESSISVNESAGGTLTPSETQAKAGSTITLTASPTGSNYLASIEVSDASGNPVHVNWDGVFDNTVTFNMPNSDVIVTPVWTSSLSAEAGHFFNIPVSGTVDIDIPAGSSLKVYDCGGEYGGFTSCGNLRVNAPAGNGLLLTGKVWRTDGKSELRINNEKRDAYNTYQDFGFIVTDNVMEINIPTDKVTPKGYDLTVSVVDPSEEHSISVESVEGGSIIPSVSDAGNNTPVTLTVLPETGYMLKDINVVGEGNHFIGVDNRDDLFDNTVTFTMPLANVTVTPVWTNNLTSTEIYVNMPKTGTRKIDLTEGTSSLMVYDAGGQYGGQGMDADGYLQLTAPAGYTMEVTGSICTHNEKDSLTIYDGNTDKAELFKGRSATTGVNLDIGTIQSTSNRLTFHLGATYSYDGIALLVTLKPAGALSFNYYGDNKRMAFINDEYMGTEAINTPAENVAVDTVVWNRSFSAGGYSTLMVPFDIKYVNFGGNKALVGVEKTYVFKSVGIDPESGDSAVFVSACSNILAYKPYLIKIAPEELDEGKLTFRMAYSNTPTIQAIPDMSQKVWRSSDEKWEFRPTLQKTVWDEDHVDLGSVYGFAAGSNSKVAVGDFVRAKAGAWIKPFRGYLAYVGENPQLSRPAPIIDPNKRYSYKSAPAAMLPAEELPDRMRVVVVDEGEDGEEHTTTIGTLDTRTGEFKMLQDYDLKGRKLNGKPSAHGMFYGKKVLKK